jgi:hypothetical protein
MFTCSGYFEKRESFTAPFIAGYYMFTVLIYEYDPDTLANGDIILTFNSQDIKATTNFIKEFTVTQLEDIGKPVRFVIIDSTSYLPGMQPLSLFAWVNNSDVPRIIRFKFQSTQNQHLKRMQFDVPHYKSCVIEFDPVNMRTHALT